MPKMDGLQILSIARRKYPHLRLVVLTGVRDGRGPILDQARVRPGGWALHGIDRVAP
jgi:DNA-binding NarL/FixJ family response regulator